MPVLLFVDFAKQAEFEAEISTKFEDAASLNSAGEVAELASKCDCPVYGDAIIAELQKRFVVLQKGDQDQVRVYKYRHT